MGFMAYLLMGSLVYCAGFMIHRYYLKPKKHTGVVHMRSPIVWALLAGCFAVMLVISALIGYFVLEHQPIDWSYVFVNSLVGTVVFGFGLLPDETQMNLPQ